MKIKRLYEEDDRVSAMKAAFGAERAKAGTSNDLIRFLDKAARMTRSSVKNTKRVKKYNPDEKSKEPEFPVVAVMGEPGAGKTAVIKKWVNSRNLNLNITQISGWERADLIGFPKINDETGRTEYHPSGAFADIEDDPDHEYVLFLDEYNRAPDEVRGTMLTLLNNHQLPDKVGMKTLENLLFVVIAINPAEEGNKGANKLNSAEIDRLFFYYLETNPESQLEYYESKSSFGGELDAAKRENDIEEVNRLEGILAMAKHILTYPGFKFTDASQRSLNQKSGDTRTLGKSISPRGLTKALEFCDGTKEDFLMDLYSSLGKYGYEVIDKIMQSYEDIDFMEAPDDVDDEANRTVDEFTDNGKTISNAEEISNYF